MKSQVDQRYARSSDDLLSMQGHAFFAGTHNIGGQKNAQTSTRFSLLQSILFDHLLRYAVDWLFLYGGPD